MPANLSGWWFIELNQESKVAVSGQIKEAMSANFYLCTVYAGKDNDLQHGRVVAIGNMQSWLLFESQSEYSRWLSAQFKLSSANTPPEAPAEEFDTPGPEALRAQALAEVADNSPKASTGAEDQPSPPVTDAGNGDEEATEYGFACTQCEHPYNAMIAPLAGEKFVRSACPNCSKTNKTAA